jgi:hypothetical protein
MLPRLPTERFRVPYVHWRRHRWAHRATYEPTIGNQGGIRELFRNAGSLFENGRVQYSAVARRCDRQLRYTLERNFEQALNLDLYHEYKPYPPIKQVLSAWARVKYL